MSATLLLRLIDLLPGIAGSAPPLLAGTVAAVHSDGTATINQPGGGFVRVRNPDGKAVAAHVFFQSGAIVGDAPALPLEIIEI